MSEARTVAVRCPQCQAEDTAEIWESVNASLNPQQKDALLKGNLNTFVCRTCGTKFLIPVAFMYHDMERRICIQYYPFETMRKAEFFEHFAINGDISRKITQNLNLPEYMRRRQVVFDMSELVRYVIFRERLFDYREGEDEEEEN